MSSICPIGVLPQRKPFSLTPSRPSSGPVQSDAVRWGLSGPHRTGAFRRGHLRYGGGVVPFPRGVLTLPADRTRESTTRRAKAALAQQETVLGPRPAAEVRESLPPGLSRMYEG